MFRFWLTLVAFTGLALLAFGPPGMDWFGWMVLVAIGWAILHNARKLDRAMDRGRSPRAGSSTPLPPPPRTD